MIPALIIDVREDVEKLAKFTERGFRRLLKPALKDAVLDWHKRFAKHHFTRAAYSRYGASYPARKRAPKKPFVVSGHLRDFILRAKTLKDVSGTSKKVRLKMKFGRPRGMTEEKLKTQVFIEMRKSKIDFKTAQRRVFSKAGYSKRVRDLLAKGIQAVHTGEFNAMRKVIKASIIKRMNASQHKTMRKRRIA